MKYFFRGIATGVILGAVAGVLLAPKSGKETRSDIKKVYSRVLVDVRDKLLAVQHISEDMYHEMVDAVVSEYRSAENLTQCQVEEITQILRDKWKEATRERK